MSWQPVTPRTVEKAEPLLQVYLLGSVEFEAVLALQRLLHYQIAGQREQAALILCEHPPLITVGRQGSRAHILYEPEDLKVRRWPVRWVNRGGGCWLHLPGQLAVYPILALDRQELGLHDYLQRLQMVLAEVLGDFQIQGELRSGQAGVWVRSRLIASIGVAVRDWVTYYGAAFNIHPDLRPFRHVLCGGDEAPMTSLERERRGPLRASLVRERLVEYFAARFGFPQTALFFGHPSLSQKTSSGAVTTHSG